MNHKSIGMVIGPNDGTSWLPPTSARSRFYTPDPHRASLHHRAGPSGATEQQVPFIPPPPEALHNREQGKSFNSRAKHYTDDRWQHTDPPCTNGNCPPQTTYGDQVNHGWGWGDRGADPWKPRAATPAPAPRFDIAAAKLAPLREKIAQLEAENQKLMDDQHYDEERRLRHRLQELQAGNWYLTQRRAYGY
ncbi:hypothetical protein ONZ45_g1650 [Pleurotus djamor]|nr:hypothetical protein ONZ45_g1650 [Pleurotus djamor]